MVITTDSTTYSPYGIVHDCPTTLYLPYNCPAYFIVVHCKNHIQHTVYIDAVGRHFIDTAVSMQMDPTTYSPYGGVYDYPITQYLPYNCPAIFYCTL